MLKPLHRMFAYIQLLRKYMKLLKDFDLVQQENTTLRMRHHSNHEQSMYELERMQLKRQPIRMRDIQSRVSDYYRIMDTECYPLYAPLAKYLQRIGAYGDSSNIWNFPNGARIWIDPRMSTGLCFCMKILPEVKRPELMDGWTTSVWIKSHPNTHISPQAVQEVVQALKHYMSVQRF